MNILQASRRIGRKGMNARAPSVVISIRRQSEERDPLHLVKCFAVIAGAVGLGYGYRQVFPEGTNKIQPLCNF